MFWDVHSHVVPSGDDGVKSLEEGITLCRTASERGTSVLFATPHVWPSLTLTEEREGRVRAAYAELVERTSSFGLDLRLGFELTPAPPLLDEDLERYRPAIIAVRNAAKHPAGAPFLFLPFLLEDPTFRRMWQQYEIVRPIEGYDFYRRTK